MARVGTKQVAPFIDGELTESDNDGRIDVTCPSNGQHLFSIPTGSDQDVNRAVTSGRSAFEDGRWRGLSPSSRKAILHRIADLIASQSARLDQLDAEEMGKPVVCAAFDALSAANLMRFYAEAVDKVEGTVLAGDDRSFVGQRQVPRGVVAAIVPWNFPTFNAALKIAPALAAGNSVILKPSELSSRSGVLLAELALQGGIPPGVFNLVPGLGETVGRSLGLHMEVDMVTFTGSTEVGKQMLSYAGQSNMKVVLAECGGKSPQIVFDDGVDLDAAAECIARALLTNQGQVCSVGSRLLVQRSIEARMVRKIAHVFSEVVMGDALDPKTTFGPLVSAKQCARVMEYIDVSMANGGRVATGGQRALPHSGGYFIEPTILCNVQPEARVAQEEIFGPVLTVIPFEDEAEAMRIANGTTYGLVAYVWTAGLARAMRMANGIRSAVVINASAPLGEGPGSAFSSEPARQSGVGVEGGMAGLESYLRRQLVWINHG